MNIEQRQLLIMAKKTALVCLALLKSLFSAVTQVAWGIAGLFLMSAGFFYLHEKYAIDITSINPFYGKIVTIIVDNMMSFFLVFLILYAFFEIKEVLKK